MSSFFQKVFPVYASTFVLLAIAHDRFTCICRPFVSCLWNYKLATKGILIAWLFACFVSLPQFFIFGLHPLDPRYSNSTKLSCSVKWESRSHERFYISYHASSQFIIPLFILTFFYTKIIVSVSKLKSRFTQGSVRVPNNKRHSAATKRNLFKTMRPITTETLNRTNCNDYMVRHYNPRRNFSIDNSLSIDTKNKSLLFSMRSMSTTTAGTSIAENNRINTDDNSTLSKTKLKTIKFTLTVVITYIFCSLPFYLSILVSGILEEELFNYDFKLIRKFTKKLNLISKLIF
jgi:hypothetical protein